MVKEGQAACGTKRTVKDQARDWMASAGYSRTGLLAASFPWMHPAHLSMKCKRRGISCFNNLSTFYPHKLY